MVHPWPQTPQGESVAKPETTRLIILSIACKWGPWQHVQSVIRKAKSFAADCGPPNSDRGWIEWVVRLKCGDTAWTARPRLLSTHLRVASRAVYSTRVAALSIRGPRILRPTCLMFSQPMSLLVSHNLVLGCRVKNVYRHLLCFLTLMFSNKVKNRSIYFSFAISETYMCRLSMPFFA